MINDLCYARIFNAKASENDIPQILLPRLKVADIAGSAPSGHLVGGETYDNISSFTERKRTSEQGDMSIMDGIESASYSDSGHTGPQTRVLYKYLTA